MQCRSFYCRSAFRRVNDTLSECTANSIASISSVAACTVRPTRRLGDKLLSFFIAGLHDICWSATVNRLGRTRIEIHER